MSEQNPASPATTQPERLRTMDQERAEFALRQIERIANGDRKKQIETSRHLTGLPALVRMNGLGQALAFYRMKGGSHVDIYDIIGEWLCAAGSKGRIFDEADDVLAAITRSDMFRYMAAQNEALALLEWLKKFALALLEKE